MNKMDGITGPVAYEVAEELGLIDKLIERRQRVKEKRGDDIKGTFNGILRALGTEMGERHGEYGER
jgi:hypothetical protein